MKTYLCSIYQKQKFIDFSLSELTALASLHGISHTNLYATHNLSRSLSEDECSEHFTPLITQTPFIYVNLPSTSVCEEIAKRAVCIERFTFPIAEADSLSNLVNDTVQKYNTDSEIAKIISDEGSFAFRFDTFKQGLSQETKEEIVKSFGVIPFNGSVDLRMPQRKFIVSVTKHK